MNDIADLQRTVEAAKQAVVDSLRQKQAEMEQCKVQYERITQECEQLRGMLRSLALTVEDVGCNRSRTIMCDPNTKVSPLGHASWATEGPTEHVAAVVEDNVEFDSGNFRLGLQRMLKKSRAQVPKVAEVEESRHHTSRTFPQKS